MKRKTVYRVYIAGVKTNHYFSDSLIASAYIHGDKHATIKRGWVTTN